MPAAIKPPSHSSLAELENLERRFELLLKDLRIYRRQRTQEEKEKGVLGSRGLTEFIVNYLQSLKPIEGSSLQHLLHLAERAGYTVPTLRTMSKRLSERSYRVGDIGYDKQRGWHWKASQ